MSLQRHIPLLEDIHKYGAAVWEELVARHPGSSRIIRDAIRRDLLRADYLDKVPIISLGYQGRKHFGLKSNRPLSATTLLDQLAARLVTHHYENHGWTFTTRYARNIRRFTHPQHNTEYALVKRSTYTRRHLEHIVLEVFRDVLHDHAQLVHYAHGTVKEQNDYVSRPVTHRSLLPILQDAHPQVQHALTEIRV